MQWTRYTKVFEQVNGSIFSAFLELLYDGRIGRIKGSEASIVSSLCNFYQVSLASTVSVKQQSIVSFATKQFEQPDHCWQQNVLESDDGEDGPPSSIVKHDGRLDHRVAAIGGSFNHDGKARNDGDKPKGSRLIDDGSIGYAVKIQMRRQALHDSSEW